MLFAHTAGRLWFVVARDTLKAKALAARPRAGAMLRARRRAAVMRGEVRLLDPQRPASWAKAPGEFAAAPLALQTYSLRNPRELLGFAIDAPKRGPQALPGNLLLASLEPAALAVVHGNTVKSTEGAWSPSAEHRSGSENGRSDTDPGNPGSSLRLDRVPDRVARLAHRDGRAAVGLMTADGPVALPGRWIAASSRATTPGRLVRLAGVSDRGPACVTIDVSDGRRPTARRGVMLRGRGEVVDADPLATVTLEVDRATYWIGFETGTEPVDA